MAWRFLKKHSRLNRGERGDAIVEFVLVLPILLMLLFGILEIGRVLDAWIVVQNAAREGARAGSLATTTAANTTAQHTAADYLQTAFGNRDDIDRFRIGQAVIASDAVSLSVEADVHIYTPFMQTILQASVPVRATAVMPR